MSSSAMSGPPRLTPAMSSRRVQVLDFVRAYICSHNVSPSVREISNGCGISTSRTRDHLKALTRQGLLMRRPGPRGIMVPSAIEEAKRLLREAGHRVDEDFEPVDSPFPQSALMGLVELDYLPGRRTGDCGGDEACEQGGTGAGPG